MGSKNIFKVAKTFGKLLVAGSNMIDLNKPSNSILCPGDPPPYSDQNMDFRDYRGLLHPNAIPDSLKSKRKSVVSIGSFVCCNGRRTSPIYLSNEILNNHVAIIGPPNSGKTEGLILPWVLELIQAGNSVVLIDVKGDLYYRLHDPIRRSSNCRLWYWNCWDENNSNAWNWFDEIHEEKDIDVIANSILGKDKNPNQPFFHLRDNRYLKTLIWGVKIFLGDDATPNALYNLVVNKENIISLGDLCEDFRNELSDLVDDDYSEKISGLLNALSIFKDNRITRLCQSTPNNTNTDIKISDFDTQQTCLLIGAPLAGKETSEILSSIMINSLINHIYKRLQYGQQLEQNITILIDEAPRLKNRINYEEVLAISRSARTGICLTAQDVTQFGNEDNRFSVLSNCNSFITLRGCSQKTAGFLSQKLGKRTAQFIKQGYEKGPFDLFSQQNKNFDSNLVPVLEDREIMNPPEVCGQYCAVVKLPIVKEPFLVSL